MLLDLRKWLLLTPTLSSISWRRGSRIANGGAMRGCVPTAVRYIQFMALLIKNGEIVTASERYVADIWCEDEVITRIDRNISAPPGAEVIDATGKHVFPGFIDPHVHIY